MSKEEKVKFVTLKDYFHGKFIRSDFYQDDEVTYVGTARAKDIGSKKGWVISQVKNTNSYVVEFDGESYIMPASSLIKFRASTKDSGPEIRQIRKRHAEDES
jgi:hypothetical protein